MPLTGLPSYGTGGCSLRFKPEARSRDCVWLRPSVVFPTSSALSNRPKLFPSRRGLRGTAAKTCTRGLPEPAQEGGDLTKEMSGCFYNSEFCPPACRGPLRWPLEGGESARLRPLPAKIVLVRLYIPNHKFVDRVTRLKSGSQPSGLFPTSGPGL